MYVVLMIYKNTKETEVVVGPFSSAKLAYDWADEQTNVMTDLYSFTVIFVSEPL